MLNRLMGATIAITVVAGGVMSLSRKTVSKATKSQDAGGLEQGFRRA